MGRLGKITIALLLLVACKSDSQLKTNYDNSLKVVLDLQSKTIAQIQDFGAKYTVKNISEKPVNFNFSSNCLFNYTIKHKQEIMYNLKETMSCTGLPQQATLKPAESRTFQLSLEGFDGTGFDDGKYRLSAFLIDYPQTKATKLFSIK